MRRVKLRVIVQEKNVHPSRFASAGRMNFGPRWSTKKVETQQTGCWYNRSYSCKKIRLDNHYLKEESTMNLSNGNSTLRMHKMIASRMLALLLASSLAAGSLTALSAQASISQPVQSAVSSAHLSFYDRQNPPTVQSATTYASLKLPAYTNKPSVVLNKNKPRFTSTQLKVRKEYERYSSLDKYKRAQTAIACLGKKTLPTAKRGSIGMVKPAGFQTTKYDFIDGKYLYNRCHLIAYELSAENANVKNLTTGTRYMNTKGMLPYENKVAAFIKKTGKHVLYRTTPIYNGTELIPRGVTIEARSLEDNGKGICFYVYCYNVQPGVKINYKNGSSTATGNASAVNSKAGWKKVNGKWYYYKSDGKTIVKSSWLKLSGNVYYVNKNGVRVTGWQTIGGKKYYFNSSGVMATGKRTIGGKSYNFGSNGVLQTGSGGSGTNVTASYIGNKNTKKFHKASCSSVGKMNASNKVGFNSRSAAISAGYDPCKKCNP